MYMHNVGIAHQWLNMPLHGSTLHIHACEWFSPWISQELPSFTSLTPSTPSPLLQTPPTPGGLLANLPAVVGNTGGNQQQQQATPTTPPIPGTPAGQAVQPTTPGATVKQPSKGLRLSVSSPENIICKCCVAVGKQNFTIAEAVYFHQYNYVVKATMSSRQSITQEKQLIFVMKFHQWEQVSNWWKFTVFSAHIELQCCIQIHCFRFYCILSIISPPKHHQVLHLLV